MRSQLHELVVGSPAAFTDIRFDRRWRTMLSYRRRGQEFATSTEEAIGVVRCFNSGHGWGSATFATLDEVRSAISTAHEFSLALPTRHSIRLSELPPRQADIPCPEGRDPRAIDVAIKRDFVRRGVESLRSVDRRIGDVRVKWEDQLTEVVVVNSEGMVLVERRPSISMTALAVAAESGTVERALGSCSTAGALHDVETWLGGISAISERAVAALHAVPVIPGRYPVVLAPTFAGLLVHRVIGHRCAAGWHPGAALLPIGTRIGPDSLTIGDDGKTPGLRGTSAFDCEGTQPQNTTIVQNGVVVGHLHTRASAGAAGLGATGNARAPAAGFPTSRLTNTYLAKGMGTGADLIRDLDLGVYLGEPLSATDDGMVTLRAGLGRMIRRGELAEPVKGASLSGDPLGLFGMIDAVGADFTWDTAAATCSLGGQTVPVGSGAPHIRLVEALVGDQS